MAQIYEGMYLLDNEVVRAGWAGAKALVTDLLTKHGGNVLAARHWAERKLAYPIKHRERATYLLVYYELPAANASLLRRDLDLSESVLRYLMLKVDAVPPGEVELSTAEQAKDFRLPPPPEERREEPEAALEEPEAEEEQAEGRKSKPDAPEASEKGSEEDARPEAVGAAAGKETQAGPETREEV